MRTTLMPLLWAGLVASPSVWAHEGDGMPNPLHGHANIPFGLVLAAVLVAAVVWSLRRR